MCIDCDCVDFFTFAASCWWVIDASHRTCWTISLCCGAGFVMDMYVASCVRWLAFSFSAACCSLSWESCFSATAYCWKDAPPSPVASSLVANWRSSSWHASSSRVYRRLKIPRDRWRPGMQTYIVEMVKQFMPHRDSGKNPLHSQEELKRKALQWHCWTPWPFSDFH